ncbi:MAG: hypothetical protein IT350_00965 [Deltaproteobacteria bacterium]|nr:hypothetical protein [Deltaproteobacteria bacterium]
MKQQPEWIERFLYDRDRTFESEGKSWVILFDALDRTASDWPTMNELVRGLLQAVLDLRPYRRLRAKCFLRTDQLNESEVATFPDASKLMAEKAELDWPANELYGLLFQYMGNARDGAFRKAIESESWFKWPQIEGTDESVAWLPPSSLRHDAELQRRVVHTITGPWMGRDRRRGDPYTWIPNHLADSQGKTSPRSFLAALRHAADETSKQYPEHEYALHYESIKRGVQKASEIRVRELREDYPWVDTLMKPLRGKVVPCDFAEIESVWDEVLMELRSRVEQQVERLPPAQLAAGAEGVRRDLENLGIFFRIKDGRVNVPDVYRLSYNIGRKGGVPPVRRASAG